MKERVVRTAIQAVAAAAGLMATVIASALAQGRPPSKTELVLGIWAGLQAALTVVASAAHYVVSPPQQPQGEEWMS